MCRSVIGTKAARNAPPTSRVKAKSASQSPRAEIVVEDAADPARLVPVADQEILVRPGLEARIIAGIVRVAGRLQRGMEGGGVGRILDHRVEVGRRRRTTSRPASRTSGCSCAPPGVSGERICATRLMPEAQNRGSSGQPGDLLARRQAPLRPRVERRRSTVETFTPTFSKTRPSRITAMTPPPRPRLVAGPPRRLAREPPGGQPGEGPGALRVLERLEGGADPVAQLLEPGSPPAPSRPSPTPAAVHRHSLARRHYRYAPAAGNVHCAAGKNPGPSLDGVTSRPRSGMRARGTRGGVCMENVRNFADLMLIGPGRGPSGPPSLRAPVLPAFEVAPMFRYFKSLVDPYAPYAEADTPPDRLWPFLREYLRPARGVMVWTVARGPRGRGHRDLADLVRRPPRRRAGRHAAGRGLGPPRAGAGAGRGSSSCCARPLIQTLSAALLNQSLMPNVGTIVRWRTHRHVLRQSVGWFQNDFAGRIANRMMQTAPAVGEATFQTFDAMVYSADLPRRRALAARRHRPAAGLPLMVWLGLYVWLVAWTVPRVGQGVEGVLRRPLGDHRADRRQLHQHPVGEALRAHPQPRRPMPARRSSTRARPSSRRCASSR